MIGKLFIAVVIGILFQSNTLATDISREVRRGNESPGSFLELGVFARVERIPLLGFNGQNPDEIGDEEVDLFTIDIRGRFEYRRFYAQIIEDSFTDIALGFNIISTEKYNLDFIGTQYFQGISRSEFDGFESITRRDEDINLGFRGHVNFDDNLIQYEAVADVSGSHNGVIASVQYGRQFQYRNWNFHTLLGLRYISAGVLDHYFGVSEQESSASVSAYTAGDGFLPTVELGATLPLSEKWLFETTAEYSLLPESVTESPLTQGDDLFFFQAGIKRVLYSR